MSTQFIVLPYLLGLITLLFALWVWQKYNSTTAMVIVLVLAGAALAALYNILPLEGVPLMAGIFGSKKRAGRNSTPPCEEVEYVTVYRDGRNMRIPYTRNKGDDKVTPRPLDLRRRFIQAVLGSLPASSAETIAALPNNKGKSTTRILGIYLPKGTLKLQRMNTFYKQKGKYSTEIRRLEFDFFCSNLANMINSADPDKKRCSMRASCNSYSAAYDVPVNYTTLVGDDIWTFEVKAEEDTLIWFSDFDWARSFTYVQMFIDSFEPRHKPRIYPFVFKDEGECRRFCETLKDEFKAEELEALSEEERNIPDGV